MDFFIYGFEILWSEVWKGGFQLILILGLLGMYFDAAVVFVTNSSLLFRLAVAILCVGIKKKVLKLQIRDLFII